ncbi:MAG: 3-isopropylmalate dehydratase small subunit [Chloroflexota bacterium]|nr:3-isopropylmalate dehydratase small subunit [Chloroflexota bacterium]
MEPVRVITGTAVPLDRSDVDTDQIIPASWLKRVERTGFGVGLFSAWRQNEPDFVLDRPEYAGATILVAGANFGIGSSREHAVWALADHGIRAVISPKFGDIFYNNATKTGLVPVVVEPEVGRALMDAVEADPTMEISVDVERRLVGAHAIGLEAPFPLDDFTRYRLLEGLDDIGLTLRHEPAITAYEATRPDWMPLTDRTT